MNSFLYRLARLFYSNYNTAISDFTFVFPNRRAGLFFQRYLSEIIEKPLFSPEIITVNECFYSACNYQQPDELYSLFKLYEIFKSLHPAGESFDEFVFWGQMLLKDFEEVDKHLIDGQQIFRNVTELKQIDQIFNIFTEEQIDAIKRFWSNFLPVTEGKTQQDFITIWKILYPLYENFRAELRKENLATEGMVFKDVIHRLKSKEDIEQWENKYFVFVGFNALTSAEKELFKELKKRNQADFYWDYESAEVIDSHNEASRFYAENTFAFPSKLEMKPVVDSLSDKSFELISVPSQVGQAKQAYSILKKLYPKEENKKDWIKTAIVLPEENMLIPMLHSLPEGIEKVNVTMGFPLKSTSVSDFIEHIFELQRRKRTSCKNVLFYHQTVLALLNHPYLSSLFHEESKRLIKYITDNNLIYIESGELSRNEFFNLLFSSPDNTDVFLDYLLELLRKLQLIFYSKNEEEENYRMESDFLYQYYVILNRMNGIMKQKPAHLLMTVDTLMKLIRQVTAGMTIPFVGEPIDGLQIMGMLETRGLDFENVIITSFNEGVFPKRSAQNSFIPYSLRKAFNLPTTEHQESLTAYNFYRLIHHAKKIYLLYDSRTEGMQSGEVSRYYYQLYYHYGIEFTRKTIGFDLSFDNPALLSVNKSEEVMKKLNLFLSKGENSKALSASSINNYIDCSLRFYFTNIQEMREVEDVQETVEESMFGTIFHAVMEFLYEPYKNKLVHSEEIDEIIKNPLRIDRKIQEAFSKHYFKKKDQLVELEGNNLLIARVIRKYIIQILKLDKKYAPFTYINSEERCSITVPILNGETEVNIKGFIDRVDEKEGNIRILDYKTGSGSLEFKSFEDVFNPELEKRPKYVLQTFLYGMLYQEKSQGKQMTPGIYYMRDVFKNDFKTELQYKKDKIHEIIHNYGVYEEEFSFYLKKCLEEIFNPNIPFQQTANVKNCTYCSFKELCNR